MTVLVLLETSANQEFVFSSNRLRDVVGGSELLTRSTTLWLCEVLNKLQLNPCVWSHEPAVRSQTFLSEANLTASVSIVVATSGKAMLLAPDADTAKLVISAATRRTLIDAPGLDLKGVWVEVDPLTPTAICEGLKMVHQLLNRIRSQSTPTSLRFRRRPIGASCRATGVSASRRVRKPGEDREEELSEGTIARRDAVSGARWRFDTTTGLNNPNSNNVHTSGLSPSIEDFDDGDRLALVHIDTNGLGSVFANPEKLVRANENVLDAVRRFALAVDCCAAAAFTDALNAIQPTLKETRRMKLVPILAGGDDTTVVCRGFDAFAFVGRYLADFEHHTANHVDVGGRLALQGPPVPLTSCAGVVWTKAGYPLSLSMALASDLCRTAKAGVALQDMPFSAWEFHDVHDSVAVDWASVLEELSVSGGSELLVHRPIYVQGSHPKWATALGSDVTNRTHAALRQRVEVCVAAHERSQPNGLTTAQLYSLREALFFGSEVADEQFGLVEGRCGNQPELRADGPSLFFAGAPATTSLLDAMTIARNMVAV